MANLMSCRLLIASIAILLTLVNQQRINCWRVTTSSTQHEQLQDKAHKNHKLEFDRSGWRSLAESESNLLTNQQDKLRNHKSGKLIEWDDDDDEDGNNNNNYSNSLTVDKKVSSTFKLTPQLTNEVDYVKTRRPRSRRKLAPQFKASHSTNKLVFHGQLRANQTRVKLTDGLEVNVNIHRPVGINRRSFGGDTSAYMTTRKPQQLSDMITTIKPQVLLVNKLLGADSWNSPIQTQESSGSSSDWRPIVVSAAAATTRTRRSGKTHVAAATSNSSGQQLDNKWRPITRTAPVDTTTVKPFAKASAAGYASRSRFEEPFESEDELAEDEVSSRRRAKSSRESTQTKLVEPARWKPLDSTGDLMFGSTTTTADYTSEPTTTMAPATSNATTAEAAQRSASDLTYIYSSQPAVQQQQSTSAGSSYYSNYLVQQPQPQPVNEVGPLIDSTSGQLPEMIVDRTPPEQPQQQTGYDSYSQPTVSSTFQPAQPPPQRQPSTYYNSNNYAYDTSSYTSAASAFRSAPRQQQPAQPVVRQEHHYHYYQPPATPSPVAERQQQQQQQQQPQVIRELQPIMISAPPAASTTVAPPPAPQIIREIVREVPVVQQQLQPQIVQMQPARVVLQQAAPIQLTMAAPAPIVQAPQIVRDIPTPIVTFSSDQVAAYEAPAKRLMRQLSNSMPQVAIRMPAQFPRFQVPAIQLPPTRGAGVNLAPVTRQTASYIIPPMPKKTTTLLTETQAMPTHTTIMQTTQFTPATRTTVYTTDHQQTSTAGDRTSSTSTNSVGGYAKS